MQIKYVIVRYLHNSALVRSTLKTVFKSICVPIVKSHLKHNIRFAFRARSTFSKRYLRTKIPSRFLTIQPLTNIKKIYIYIYLFNFGDVPSPISFHYFFFVVTAIVITTICAHRRAFTLTGWHAENIIIGRKTRLNYYKTFVTFRQRF